VRARIVGINADLRQGGSAYGRIGVLPVAAPGQSALRVLVVEATADKVMDEMKQFGGTGYQTSLSKEDEENMRKVLEHKSVSAAAGEMLELE
jgi:hypothetical protein